MNIFLQEHRFIKQIVKTLTHNVMMINQQVNIT